MSYFLSPICLCHECPHDFLSCLPVVPSLVTITCRSLDDALPFPAVSLLLDVPLALPCHQGVPAARQKLMAKGAWKGILKDDMNLSGCSIKEGQQVW